MSQFPQAKLAKCQSDGRRLRRKLWEIWNQILSLNFIFWELQELALSEFHWQNAYDQCTVEYTGGVRTMVPKNTGGRKASALGPGFVLRCVVLQLCEPLASCVMQLSREGTNNRARPDSVRAHTHKLHSIRSCALLQYRLHAHKQHGLSYSWLPIQ
jgi:hypothetical protein